MSKKDFEGIAAVIRDEYETAVAMFEPMHAEGIETVAKRIGSALGDANPRFDLLRFLRACGLSDEQIGAQR